MKDRDVEAALETARDVFAGELKIDECLEYIKALLGQPKQRMPVAVVQAITDSTSSGEVRDISVDIVGDGGTLNVGDRLYTDPPRLKDGEFRDSVNELRELTRKYAGTEQLRAQLVLFLRDFEAAVRGEK